MAGNRADHEQPAPRPDVRDQPAVRWERRRDADREPPSAVGPHIQNYDPAIVGDRQRAAVRWPRWLAPRADRLEPVRRLGRLIGGTGPDGTIAHDRKPAILCPDCIGGMVGRRSLLADPVDPVEQYRTIGHERDHGSQRQESGVRRGTERAVHTRPVGVDNPDPRIGEHNRAAVRRPTRPHQRRAHVPTDAPRPAAVGTDQDAPPAVPRRHCQQPVAARERSRSTPGHNGNERREQRHFDSPYPAHSTNENVPPRPRFRWSHPATSAASRRAGRHSRQQGEAMFPVLGPHTWLMPGVLVSRRQSGRQRRWEHRGECHKRTSRMRHPPERGNRPAVGPRASCLLPGRRVGMWRHCRGRR